MNHVDAWLGKKIIQMFIGCQMPVRNGLKIYPWFSQLLPFVICIEYTSYGLVTAVVNTAFSMPNSLVPLVVGFELLNIESSRVKDLNFEKSQH